MLKSPGWLELINILINLYTHYKENNTESLSSLYVLRFYILIFYLRTNQRNKMILILKVKNN